MLVSLFVFAGSSFVLLDLECDAYDGVMEAKSFDGFLSVQFYLW